MQTFGELTDHGPFGDGRVTLGFAFDLFFLPPDKVKGLFAHVKAKGIKTIAYHGSIVLALPVILKLYDLNLLNEHIIVSRGGAISRTDAELLKAKGAHLSSTPSTELQMAMSHPYCFDASFLDGCASGDSIGLQENASIGVDCHSCASGSTKRTQ